ncbi:MAG: formimidoylglutamase, partial [Chitinophagales bacterium]|nr:formimidoylglutamase [Chitinophagales bacterium]
MFSEYLTPTHPEDIFSDLKFLPNQIGSHVHFYKGEDLYPGSFDLAIVSVCEARGNHDNEGSALAPHEIKKQLYQLYLPSKHQFRLIDLGSIIPGKTPRDTYYAVAGVVLGCITRKIVPIIIGGSHDLAFGQYLGYQDLLGIINVVNIDGRIDLGAKADEQLHAHSFLLHLLLHQPNYLFNYQHLAYQSYLNDPSAVDTLESLGFDCYRLGTIQSNVETMEPVLRDADMVTVDISCLRMSDAPAQPKASPHGLYGEELCQIVRYAGMSDRVSSIGFYELNPHYDINQQSAQL